MARVRSDRVLVTGAGFPALAGAVSPVALAFTAFDRVATARGLAPVSGLAAGDQLTCWGDRPAIVAAIVRQTVNDAGFGVALNAGVVSDRDVVLPEDQLIRVEDPSLATISGCPAAMLRVGDLVEAGIGRRVALPDAPRFHVVLDRPAFIPFNGLALAPFIPSEVSMAGLDVATRAAVFAQDPRLRYSAATEALRPDLPCFNARETRIAARRIWTDAVEAGNVAGDPLLQTTKTSCAPGISGPQLLQPSSGPSRRPQIIC